MAASVCNAGDHYLYRKAPVRVNLTIMISKTARTQRANRTEAEIRLWQRLRDRQLYGAKFRRQTPVAPYIADFMCDEARLIVEVDGGQHSLEADTDRTAWLESQGFRVIRFWNHDVLQNTGGILERIQEELKPDRDEPASSAPPHRKPLPPGERA